MYASNLIHNFTQFLSQNVCCKFFSFFFNLHLVYYPKFIANCTTLLDAAKQFANNGCCIVACIQSLSSAINYHIKATMNAGIHAAKLNIWCRQIVASIVYSINHYIQSVWSSWNYHNKSKKSRIRETLNLLTDADHRTNIFLGGKGW